MTVLQLPSNTGLREKNVMFIVVPTQISQVMIVKVIYSTLISHLDRTVIHLCILYYNKK